MSDQKKIFDLTPKQSLLLGLSWGLAIISVIGFIVLLTTGFSAEDSTGAKVINTNVNAAANPTPTPSAPAEDAGDISKLSPVSNSDYIRGNKNAKVTLIVVSDFQCPYCQRHEETINQIMEAYPKDVRVIWRHFPLTSIHPYAQKASEAAECAGEQGKFWEMHDKMFENQSALDDASLKSYAKALGLNSSKFDSCLSSGKYTEKVNKQAQEAPLAGISGTPGTFVNDTLVKGAYPFETFKGIIDELLK